MTVDKCRSSIIQYYLEFKTVFEIIIHVTDLGKFLYLRVFRRWYIYTQRRQTSSNWPRHNRPTIHINTREGWLSDLQHSREQDRAPLDLFPCLLCILDIPTRVLAGHGLFHRLAPSQGSTLCLFCKEADTTQSSELVF